MRKNINSKIEREIAEILGHSAHKDMTVDEVLAMMLQVFLPVLMVFIISYFLFKSDVQKEIAKTQDVYEDPIVDNQLQTLTNALDKLEYRERKALALLVFSKTDNTENTILDTTGLIDKGRLVENQLVKSTFISGCSYAKKIIPFQEKMAKRWFDEVTGKAGVNVGESDFKMLTDPKVLVAQNRTWLLAEIENRIHHLAQDTKRLQSMAISELQKYYIDNPDSLDNDEISKLLTRAIENSDIKEKTRLIESAERLIKEHAYDVFKSQGVELLNNI